jgi:hypothetical protein
VISLIKSVKEELPKAPPSINADLMTVDEIRAKLQEGYDDIKAGRVQDAKTALEKFKESC